MPTRRSFIKIIGASAALLWVGSRTSFFKSAISSAENADPMGAHGAIKLYSVEKHGYIMSERISKAEGEWKKLLTPSQYHVLREKGTEMAFTGQYWNNEEKGTYICAACKNDLFSSKAKFESGTGWPSFWEPIARENIIQGSGNDFFGREILCARCQGHLGHVFNDGPKPTGLRYCINSVSLLFVKA